MASSTGVNVPTNTKIKEKDINSKLQLFGIYSAFANGKVPSNKQIDVAMNTALEWGPMRQPSKNLSDEGKVLVADVRDVIEKAKIMLLTKNDGNLLQDFIWQTQGVGSNGVQKPGMPIEKDQAKQHGQEAVQGLRTLGELIITNGQFRKLLSDATVLLRDIAGDAAQKAASNVKPNEDQLNQIDQPAEDNTWHEKPDFQGMKSNIQSKIPSKKEAQDVADGARADAQAQGHAEDKEGAKKGAKAGVQNLKSNIGGRFDENQKEQMRQYRERTNNYFKEKVPKERRDQTIFRLKKMIVEIQTHQDYQQAVETLLRLAEEYAGHGQHLAKEGSGTAKGAHDQDTLKTAETDLKVLLERFANSTSFDDLTDSINQIYRDAERDPELKQWFKDMDKFIRRCLQEQGYVIEEQSNQDWRSLHDKGQYLLREKYKTHVDRVFDEVKFVAGQFDEDPHNKAFANSMDKLFKDLGNDQDGKPTFKPHLVKDLTEVLIPAFFENIRYVPIPRIEFSDPMIDAVIENLVIEGDNLAPNVFEFGSDNFWRWGRKGNASKNKNKVMLSASGIQMDLRDVAYYVKKKQGFPGITDKGVMDIFLGGTGLSFKVGMETADKSDKDHFFKINTVTVDIKNMNIKLKESNHKLLFALAKPLLLKVMKPVVQKVAEKQIRDQVRNMDAFLYKVKQEADRAAEEAKHSPAEDKAPNFYNRIFNAYQKELQKGKEKKEAAKAKTEDKHVNVAMTQQDSMFKNISLPGGISTKATEYKQLAEKGDKWESPVFSIGSAKASSNLPPPSNPTRKPHSTATPKSTADGAQYGSNSMTNNAASYGTNNATSYGTNNASSYGTNNATSYGNSNSTPQQVTDGGIVIR